MDGFSPSNYDGLDSYLALLLRMAAFIAICLIRHQALGGNAVWQNMIAMMMTGSIVQSKTWSGVRVANFIGGKMHTELGGCTYETDCPFSMVRNCYGCLYFRPFDDGNHEKLLKSTQE